MTTTEPIKLYRGSRRTLRPTVYVDDDIVLDAQAVAISFDRETWIAAEWIGSAGSARRCEGPIELAEDATPGGRPLYVRVGEGDDPDVVILRAGGVEII